MKTLSVLLFLSSSVFCQTPYQKDFSEFWTDINDNYAYMQNQGIDWTKVKEIYQPVADTIKSRDAFIRFLETVINELHNGHISLNTNLNSSNRIIPSGSDVFVEKIGPAYFITDIRKNFPAELCGLRPGMQVIKFNGEKIERLLPGFLPRYTGNYDNGMYEYALNMLFAGTHNIRRVITTLENGYEKNYFPDDSKIPAQAGLLECRLLKNNTGYIRINNSLFNNDLIPAFDKAIDSLQNTKGLIIDLTETPGGGNSAVARAIMSRFTDSEMPYQMHEAFETQFKIRRSWVEYVTPRKMIYKNEVIIMAGHWTGSMGEGIVIGFDGMKRAKIVGTKMAGLLGAIEGFTLSETKIGYQIPTERLYHVNGIPREDFRPEYMTDNIYSTWDKVNEMVEKGH